MERLAVTIPLIATLLASTNSKPLLGAAPIQFCNPEGTRCRSTVLPTYRLPRSETETEIREELAATCGCHDPNPALCFPWRTSTYRRKPAYGDQLCDTLYNVTTQRYAWEVYATANNLSFLAAPDFLAAANVTKAEIASLWMQGLMYMDTPDPSNLSRRYPEFDIPHMLGEDPAQLGPLPETYSTVLRQIGSGVGALREMPQPQKDILRRSRGNTGPNARDHLLQHCPPSICSGAAARRDWFAMFRGASAGAGEEHPVLPFCSSRNRTSPALYLSNNIESFSTDKATAVKYAGNGSLLVVFGSSQGPQPFSGEFEFLLAPGARVKQIECDVVDMAEGKLHVSYGVEQTGDAAVDRWLTAEKEESLLAEMKALLSLS